MLGNCYGRSVDCRFVRVLARKLHVGNLGVEHVRPSTAAEFDVPYATTQEENNCVLAACAREEPAPKV